MAVAGIVAFVPLPASLVERYYSIAVFPGVQRLVTPLSNKLPIAVLDCLLVVVAATVLVLIVRGIRHGWRTRSAGPVLRVCADLIVLSAALYLVFALAWGLNYRRLPMGERLVMDRGTPTTDDVVRLGFQAVDGLNRSYRAAHEAPETPTWLDENLRNAFADVQRELSDAAPAQPGRPKTSLLAIYFRWAGVDGMINPFGLEVLVNPDLLPFERPFVVSHEWGHLAGYADEADANFVGWLTCMHASAAAQYSGWMYLYWEISSQVDQPTRERLSAALAPGPLEDIDAVVTRLRRGQIPALRQASWQVYDQYLKANRVEAGVRSYGAVVSLILRVRFDSGWTPVRRPTT